MKKLCFAILFTLVTVCLACPASSGNSGIAGTKNLRILASTFPVYLFARNICADVPDVQVEILVPAAAGCPHDFALRPGDMQKMAHSNVLIVNGAGLEDFLQKPLEQMGGQLALIDAGKNVPLLEEKGHDHDHGHDHTHGHGHGNPHIFAAPDTAILMARNIADGLAAIDASHADLYQKNARLYTDELGKISERLQKIGENAKNPRIVLEHDGLAYLAANARLDVVEIIENGLSAAALGRLGKKLPELNPALLVGESQYPDRLLQTLSEETGLPFARLDTCASGPGDAPLDYYQKVMNGNLVILGKYFE